MSNWTPTGDYAPDNIHLALMLHLNKLAGSIRQNAHKNYLEDNSRVAETNYLRHYAEGIDRAVREIALQSGMTERRLDDWFMIHKGEQ